MAETFEHSGELKDLAAALAKAQAKVKGATKDATNPHFRSKYADLSSIWDACRSALTENGLSVVQAPGLATEGPAFQATLTTMLLHSSGQWIRSTAAAPLTKDDAQGVGSALTYLRRYALAAYAGVAPEDDDGNAAAQPRAPAATTGSVGASALPTDKQAPAAGAGSLWPVGAKKGVPLKDLTSDELISGKKWLEKAGRNPELYPVIEDILESRRGE